MTSEGWVLVAASAIERAVSKLDVSEEELLGQLADHLGINIRFEDNDPVRAQLERLVYLIEQWGKYGCRFKDSISGPVLVDRHGNRLDSVEDILAPAKELIGEPPLDLEALEGRTLFLPSKDGGGDWTATIDRVDEMGETEDWPGGLRLVIDVVHDEQSLREFLDDFMEE